MADEADMAQEFEQRALEHALAYRKESVHLPPKGICYNCGEPLAEPRPFCDADCCEDWEKRRNAQAQKIF